MPPGGSAGGGQPRIKDGEAFPPAHFPHRTQCCSASSMTSVCLMPRTSEAESGATSRIHLHARIVPQMPHEASRMVRGSVTSVRERQGTRTAAAVRRRIVDEPTGRPRVGPSPADHRVVKRIRHAPPFVSLCKRRYEVFEVAFRRGPARHPA
jgi:hypothetical protein